MKVRFLEVEQVLLIQQRLIDIFGGLHGLKDIKSLEAAIMRPQTGYYTGLNEQAAALMESLANNHPFLDGNKRVAFFVTDAFLRLNGYWINCDAEETYVYFMQLFDNDQFKFKALLDWLDTKVQPL